MAVNESANALTAVAASGTPAGTDQIGTDLDDHLRDIKKNIRIAIDHQFSTSPDEPTVVPGTMWLSTSRTASLVYELKLADTSSWASVLSFNFSSDSIEALNLRSSAIPVNTTTYTGGATSAIPASSILGSGSAAPSTMLEFGSQANSSIPGDSIRVSEFDASSIVNDAYIFTGQANSSIPGDSIRVSEIDASAIPAAALDLNLTVAKGWSKFSPGGISSAGLNIASITDVGTGDFKVNWDTDFAGEDYACGVNASDATAEQTGQYGGESSSEPTGAVFPLFYTNAEGSVAEDPDYFQVVAFGAP